MQHILSPAPVRRGGLLYVRHYGSLVDGTAAPMTSFGLPIRIPWAA